MYDGVSIILRKFVIALKAGMREEVKLLLEMTEARYSRQTTHASIETEGIKLKLDEQKLECLKLKNQLNQKDINSDILQQEIISIL
ncbi:MAG: hypothetical protein MHMPM18_003529 [Marteilia pararefringens]